MLNSYEHDILNTEYIRCIRLIREYDKRGQKCIVFKLRSLECLINKKMYEKILNSLKETLIHDNYDVYISTTELLIFWDTKVQTVKEPIQSKLLTVQSRKKKNEEVNIEHIDIPFGDYVDHFPIKTGEY